MRVERRGKGRADGETIGVADRMQREAARRRVHAAGMIIVPRYCCVPRRGEDHIRGVECKRRRVNERAVEIEDARAAA